MSPINTGNNMSNSKLKFTIPTICPKMNQSMLQLQEEFYGNPNFGIASITIDPAKDTPQVLK